MLNKILFLYISLMSSILLGFSVVMGGSSQNAIPILLFFPNVLYIAIRIYPSRFRRAWLTILLYINTLISSLLMIAYGVTVSSMRDLLICLSILPFPLYYWSRLLDLWWPSKPANCANKKTPPVVASEYVIDEQLADKKRRVMLRWLAQAGLGMLLLGLWEPKKAQAAFFGSIPGPGTVALKDSNGTKIDPAVKQPTDGYSISEVDESSSPAYYGFVNKDGAWYIMRDAGDGTYRYCRGESDFVTSWTGRAGLTYGTFDSIF